MSASARSVLTFAIDLFGLGLGLVLVVAPNVLLQLFGVPVTSEVWIRVVGMLVLLLGFYYSRAALREMTEFFRWTVFVRSTVIVFFTAFVLLGFVSPVLILFGAVDLLGAVWTGLALRSERSAWPAAGLSASLAAAVRPNPVRCSRKLAVDNAKPRRLWYKPDVAVQ